jgi:hypothetical protein
MIRQPGHHEEQIRETVQVGRNALTERKVAGRQRRRGLRTPANRPRNMEGAGAAVLPGLPPRILIKAGC